MPEQGIPRVSRRSSVSTVILPSLIDRPSLHSHRCRPSSLIADLARVVDLGNWPRRSYRREAARRSDHSDNAGHLDPRPGGARLSTSGRSPRENQAPDKESQPIHLTQEVSGSALRPARRSLCGSNGSKLVIETSRTVRQSGRAFEYSHGKIFQLVSRFLFLRSGDARSGKGGMARSSTRARRLRAYQPRPGLT
jgi:hypothetical protein